MTAHEAILRSGAGLFYATENVSRENWRTFVDNLDLDLHYPGIQGYGFSMLISPDILAQHTAEIRAQGFPEYQVRPDGERENYTSIIYIEPFSGRNLKAFGYDMFSEPVRRYDMERARDQPSTQAARKRKWSVKP
ncbi:MAG: hypothetical protein C0401_12340 [Anaerolinea sp.]|nr:hypothetical protein [Anaerolinea sp.]